MSMEQRKRDILEKKAKLEELRRQRDSRAAGRQGSPVVRRAYSCRKLLALFSRSAIGTALAYQKYGRQTPD